MKTIFIFLLFNIISLTIYAQELPIVPCENREIDSVKILKKMQDLGYLLDSNSIRFIVIYPLVVIPDTVKNSISYNIEEDKPLLYFPEMKSGTNNYACASKTQFYQYQNYSLGSSILPRSDKNSFYMAISESEKRNPECIYTLVLFPELRNEDFAQYQMTYYKTPDGKEYVFDERYRYFHSIKELLEYKFGSVENYIQTYKKRIAWQKQNSEEQRKNRQQMNVKGVLFK